MSGYVKHSNPHQDGCHAFIIFLSKKCQEKWIRSKTRAELTWWANTNKDDVFSDLT